MVQPLVVSPLVGRQMAVGLATGDEHLGLFNPMAAIISSGTSRRLPENLFLCDFPLSVG